MSIDNEGHDPSGLGNTPSHSEITRLNRLLAALDTFSKALSMPGGPSLTVQRHDPSWMAWKQLCDAAAEQPAPAAEEDEPRHNPDAFHIDGR